MKKVLIGIVGEYNESFKPHTDLNKCLDIMKEKYNFEYEWIGTKDVFVQKSHLLSHKEHPIIKTIFDTELFTSMYLDNIYNSNIYYIVYETESTIIGFASLHIQKLLHHVSKVAEVQELIVTESYRSHGIGKILFDELKIIAKEEGCSQIEVCSNISRESTHKFYQKNKMHKTHYKFTNCFDC